MNKWRFDRLSWVLCTLLLMASHTWGQDLPTAKPEDVGVSSEKVEKLSAFMQSLVDQGKIPGGVTMMARHGKVIHLKAVGLADRETKKPMTTDAIFRLASMSKLITTVGAMVLVDRGKLALDDPVSRCVPEFANPKVLVSLDPWQTEPAKREITIRQLLTHTSGLASCFDEVVGPLYDAQGIQGGVSTMQIDLQEIMARLARIPLVSQPGERFSYGISSDLLGRVIEVASGMTLDRFIESEVCRPLGMTDTHFCIPPQKLSRLVDAYIPVETCLRKVKKGETLRQEFGKGIVTISSDYCYGPWNRFKSGGGGLCSTASDYLRLCQMLLNRGELGGVRLLKKDTVNMMTSNQIGDLAMRGTPGKFGFGLALLPETSDIHEQLRGSYAWAGYWSTSFRISPRGDWILVTMSQLAWDDKETPAWFAEYERIAAEAIEK